MAGPQVHRAALHQFFIVTLISTCPIWLGAVYVWLVKEDAEVSFGSFVVSMKSSLLDGELFFYCTSVLATIFYLGTKDIGLRNWRNWPSFPYRSWFLTLSLLGLLISVVFFSANFANPVKASDTVFFVSFYVYIFSLILYYIATVIDSASTELGYQSLQQTSREDAVAFTEALKEHRAGNAD
jgi:hypothetical protein